MLFHEHFMNIAIFLHFDDGVFLFTFRISFFFSILHLLFPEFAFGNILHPLRFFSYSFHMKHFLITDLPAMPLPSMRHMGPQSAHILDFECLTNPFHILMQKWLRHGLLKLFTVYEGNQNMYRSDDNNNIGIKNWPRYRLSLCCVPSTNAQ